MAKRKPYVECPICGDHNDYGEVCECQKHTRESNTLFKRLAENYRAYEEERSYGRIEI